jgi:hypothetical protein
MIENVFDNKNLMSIIIRSDFQTSGVHFFTDNSFSQQLGYMYRETGYNIEPHRHNLVERNVFLTQEVLYIKKGKVRVDFYYDIKLYL